jgi:hypothetical protein
MRKVGIDSRGAYYYLDTGEDAIIAFEGANPYDVYTGQDVSLVVMDAGSGTILEISNDIKDALVAIFGNENQIRPSPTVPASVRNTAVITPRGMVQTTQEQSGGGLFSGGKIQISSETAILIGLGVLVFSFGKSRGR